MNSSDLSAPSLRSKHKKVSSAHACITLKIWRSTWRRTLITKIKCLMKNTISLARSCALLLLLSLLTSFGKTVTLRTVNWLNAQLWWVYVFLSYLWAPCSSSNSWVQQRPSIRSVTLQLWTAPKLTLCFSIQLEILTWQNILQITGNLQVLTQILLFKHKELVSTSVTVRKLLSLQSSLRLEALVFVRPSYRMKVVVISSLRSLRFSLL